MTSHLNNNANMPWVWSVALCVLNTRTALAVGDVVVLDVHKNIRQLN